MVIFKVKSNEAKVKHDIDVIETINIELEHSRGLSYLRNDDFETNIYKEKYDSIEDNITRSKNIEHTTSLIAKNDDFKAQLQEKGFAIAALKNELRKLTGNSVNTKFAKSSILGKPALQPRRNQSVVRQPTAFKSERPRISKQRFASQGFKEFSSDEQVMTSDHNSSELGIHDHSNELSSSKLVPKVVPQEEKTANITTRVWNY
ncbi:hypothetical protein Tco_0352116 [Tanacetum coccineum]